MVVKEQVRLGRRVLKGEDVTDEIALANESVGQVEAWTQGQKVVAIFINESAPPIIFLNSLRLLFRT